MVSAHLVSVGELVGVSGPTKLATIVQLDPIYVNFSLPEQDVQRIRAALAEAGVTVAEVGKIQVEIGLTTETGYPHHGTHRLHRRQRGHRHRNPGGARGVSTTSPYVLLPGFFVRIRVPLRREPQPALLVPDTALGTSQAGRYVLVVDKDNIVQTRSVHTGQTEGALRVIAIGPAAGRPGGGCRTDPGDPRREGCRRSRLRSAES